MPQLDLYGENKRTAVQWRYSIDPLKPHDPALFYVSVEGPRQLAVEHGLCSVPLNVVWEEVDALLRSTWEAYLFGEVDAVRQVVGQVSRAWREESAQRPA